ncbi:MAG TPA: protein kinase [Woeseiaceae bacterium]
MSNNADNLRNAFADQLASFDDRLDSAATDVDMLSDIQSGIDKLLAEGQGSEKQIRRVLQERYDAGTLRKETFQLVKSMLDRYVTEKVPTSPVPAAAPAETGPERMTQAPPQAAGHADGDDQFGSTTVIPAGLVPLDSAEDRVQVGSVLRDRFMLQKRVSGGSMGVVYKALDRRLAEAGSSETFVAIKILSPQLAENAQALRALQQEAAKGRCLVHQNIVRFIDLDRDDDLYFIVMEWLDGKSLADILDSNDARSIDIKAAFRIVRQVGDGLDYAHRCGIVHADVKPGNIMILPDGTAKLFDFGVARVRQKQAEERFDPGVLGAMTPAYSSMQVLTGEAPVASDDVFSLACLLYRLVAGYRVFGPRNAAEASEAGMAPQRPQGISDSQWKALKKALSYARVTRFQSVREFLDAVDQPVQAAPAIEAPERFQVEEGGSPGKWLAIFVVLLGLAGIGAKHLGYLDPLLAQLGTDGFVELPAAGESPAIFEDLPEVVEQPPVEITDTTNDPDVPDEARAVESPVDDAPADNGEVEIERLPEAMGPSTTAPPPVAATEPLIDFSKLPPADVEIRFSDSGATGVSANIVLREDAEPVIADFIREGDLTTALALRLEEVGFSGNRSPWASGQYAMSDAGLLYFPVGQERARLTLRTASDPRREADQQSTLRLREAESAETELATVVITLEDDDQRVFEARLPVNTVAFAAGQASINESDPAVQIDIVRFNPDDSSIVIGFTVDDITASEGEDYFAPGNYSISFGPGQRSARILIPLVQDSLSEGDEAFVVELAGDNQHTAIDVFHRIVVMIRDDEPPAL